MNTLRFLLLGLALLCVAAPAAGAAPKKATVGVFLPTTLNDGQQRFQYAEALASQLSTTLGHSVVAKSFGRYEDFAKAVSDGSVDYAMVESWAMVQLGARVVPVATAPLAGGEAKPRWAIISSTKKMVKDLTGARLALVKGVGAVDPRFISNVVLAGDLDARKHFKLVPVPNVESALKMLEAKSAEVALVPLAHVPEGMHVLFRSSRVPGALLVGVRGGEEALQAQLQRLPPVAPFGAFASVQDREVEDFRRLMLKGPPRRQPMMVESPLLRVDTKALVDTRVLQPVLPSFIDALDVSAEQPDD
jgi:ABC-type amino acid transport substrate-binding protein